MIEVEPISPGVYLSSPCRLGCAHRVLAQDAAADFFESVSADVAGDLRGLGIDRVVENAVDRKLPVAGLLDHGVDNGGREVLIEKRLGRRIKIEALSSDCSCYVTNPIGLGNVKLTGTRDEIGVDLAIVGRSTKWVDRTERSAGGS